MNNQEVAELILNKKFNKSVFSGYDPKDVDEFFDLVIDYLKQNDISVANYKKTNDMFKAENAKLKEEIALLKASNNNLTKQIQQYESDGYTNVISSKKQQ